MFCEKCGQELAEGTKFCTACGEKVVSVDITVPMQRVETETVHSEQVHAPQAHAYRGVSDLEYSEGAQSSKKGSKRPIIIGVVCAVIVIAIVAVLAYLLLGPNGFTEKAEVGSQVSPSSVQAVSDSSEATSASEQGEESDATENGAVFTGVDTTATLLTSDEAAKKVEEIFKGKEVNSMVYKLDNGNSIMLITDSDSFGRIQLNVEG